MVELPRSTSKVGSVTKARFDEVLEERNQFLVQIQERDRLLRENFEIIKEKDEKIRDLNSYLDNFELLKILAQSGLLRNLKLDSEDLQQKVTEVLDLWLKRTKR